MPVIQELEWVVLLGKSVLIITLILIEWDNAWNPGSSILDGRMPTAFCMPGLFSFHVLVAMTSFYSIDAAMSCSSKEESKQTPHDLCCHPAVILHGSWGNVALECSCTLTVSWGPETSPRVCSVSVHPQSSVIVTSLLPLPLQISNYSAEVKVTKSVLSEKSFKIVPLDFKLIKITEPKCA